MTQEKELMLQEEHAETTDTRGDEALEDDAPKQDGDSISSGVTCCKAESAPLHQGGSTAGSCLGPQVPHIPVRIKSLEQLKGLIEDGIVETRFTKKVRPQMQHLPVRIRSTEQLKGLIEAGIVEIRFTKRVRLFCVQRRGHNGSSRASLPELVKILLSGEANPAQSSPATSAPRVMKNEESLSSHSTESGTTSTSPLPAVPVSTNASTVVATCLNGQLLGEQQDGIEMMVANARQKKAYRALGDVEKADVDANLIALAKEYQALLQQCSPEQIQYLRSVRARLLSGRKVPVQKP